MSEDPGADIMSLGAGSLGRLKLGLPTTKSHNWLLGDLGAEASPLNASSGRGSASFVWMPSTLGNASVANTSI
jgi:hypothetical protein